MAFGAAAPRQPHLRGDATAPRRAGHREVRAPERHELLRRRANKDLDHNDRDCGRCGRVRVSSPEDLCMI